jgi:hypothetical protein
MQPSLMQPGIMQPGVMQPANMANVSVMNPFRPQLATRPLNPMVAITGMEGTPMVSGDSSHPSEDIPKEDTAPPADASPSKKAALPAKEPDSDAEESYDALALMPTKQKPRRNSKDWKWLEFLEQLKQYKADFGDCFVPRGYSANLRLAGWVAEQR